MKSPKLTEKKDFLANVNEKKIFTQLHHASFKLCSVHRARG